MFLFLLHVMKYAALLIWAVSAVLIVILIVMELLEFPVMKAQLERAIQKNENKPNVRKHRKPANDPVEMAKTKLREEKERSAHESYFEGPFAPGFDRYGRLIYRGHNVPTEKAWDYYKKMDEMADTQTMAVMDLKEL